MARTQKSKVERGHEHMVMLGTMHADQRLVTFLLDLSARYGCLGYSRSQFVLRRTRQEIGSQLGLKLETVSYRSCSNMESSSFRASLLLCLTSPL
jgi:CRP/FNR family transcriptional regulator